MTVSLTPSKDSAPPFLPVVLQVAPEIAPVCPLPDASWMAAPAPSSNAHAATGPVCPSVGRLARMTHAHTAANAANLRKVIPDLA
jgi:hypothetical protein